MTFKAAWALLQPLIVNGQEVKARAILARACGEKPEPEKKKRERPKRVNGVRIVRSELKRHDEPVAKRVSYLDKLLAAIGRCRQNQRDGMDVLSSSEWDAVVRLYEEGK